MKLRDEQTKQITEALLQGKKIEAIKVYREAAGCGLKEAKEAVDRLIEELSEEHPEIKVKNSGGCASVLTLGFLVLAGGAAVLEHWV